jgi:hypothetical protein
MVHGHPVKYRAKSLAGACHGFLRKFLELIAHRTAVLTVRIHLPRGVMQTIGSALGDELSAGQGTGMGGAGFVAATPSGMHVKSR